MHEKVMLDKFVFELGPRRQIDVNSPRSIAKIDIPGKAPDYQDMGEDEHTIGWGGVLLGDNAYDQILALEKKKGKEIKLIKGRISKTVRLRDLSYNIIRDDRIEYSIGLVEIQKDDVKVKAPPDPYTKTQVQESDSPSQPAPEPAVQQTERTYTVVGGDTLWGIAQKHLGNGNRWQEVANINGINNPRALGVGAVLKLPVA